jgi:hypothetical protein
MKVEGFSARCIGYYLKKKRLLIGIHECVVFGAAHEVRTHDLRVTSL